MEHYLDVSMLEPCEPLDQTLAATQKLGEGDYLKVLHRREPHLLYPILEQTGFAWRTIPGETTEFEIYIWRRDDNVSEELIRTQLDQV